MMIFRGVFSVFLVLVVSVAMGSPAQADTLWLDQPLTQWNQQGMAIPPVAPVSNEPAFDPRCLALSRPAETPMDHEIEAAGWSLFNAYEAGWGVTLLTGLSAYDGMCRPSGYHAFVFVDGQFAGTLAPELSAARADGALSTSETRIQNGDHLSALYVRFADSDPLCCPSRPSNVVTYRVDRTPSGPVVVAEYKSEVPR